MDKNNDIQNELGGLSPELSRLRKRENHPFPTPENYFEQMPAEMQDYVRGKVAKRKRLWMPSGLWEWAPATAVLLLVAGLTFYFLSRQDTDRIAATAPADSSMVANVAAEEVLLEELDEDFLVEAIAMVETKKVSTETQKPQDQEEMKEEIEEYILENFDESFLTDEL